MKNLRFKLGVPTTAFYVLLRAIPFSNKIIAHPQDYSDSDRHHMMMEIGDYMRRHFQTTTYVYGTKNIPQQDGFVVYSNHQGKYDAICTYLAMKRYTSVLWAKKQAERILSRQVCGLLNAVVIDLEDPRNVVRSIQKCTDIVKKGGNIIIYPEGGYDENHNELQEFHTGCFQVCKQAKAPILPVVLYDAYRSMNTNFLGPVETQIHFLEAIPYEVYGYMKKGELADYVKGLIEEKLCELRRIEADVMAGILPKDYVRSGADTVMERRHAVV